jgi:hypothetical protein
MKRLLRFFPAIIVGLLLGWVVSRAITPQPPEVVKPAPTPLLRPLTPTPKGLEAWRHLVASRCPLPPAPMDITAQMESESAINHDKSLSPARLTMRHETLRRSRSDEQAPSEGAFFGGDEGLAEDFARYAKTQPEKALRQVNRLGQTGSRCTTSEIDGFRRRVLREWLRQDPQAALAAVIDQKAASSVSQFIRGQHLTALMEEWASLDPAAAAAALPSLPRGGPGYGQSEQAESLFRNWFSKDPAAARSWAETQAAPEWRESLATVAAELTASDPAAKAAVLLASPEHAGPRLSMALADWMTADPAAAIGTITALPASDRLWQRDAASAAEHWAMLSHTDMTAEEFIQSLQSVPAGPQREALFHGLANFGSSNDIPFALQMIAEMGEGRPRNEAMGMLTELWMRKDPIKLSEWLTTLPPTPSRHAAVGRFADLLSKSDPDAAAHWARTLPDDDPWKAGLLRRLPTAGEKAPATPE